MSTNFSPSRSPVSSRFQLAGGAFSVSRLRSSSLRKPPEPLRRAVADCLSSSAPSHHGSPSTAASEASRTLRDYLAANSTIDLAYMVILEHTLAERERSPAVVARCVGILKRYLLRYKPSEETLQQIDRFCVSIIAECDLNTNGKLAQRSRSMSQQSGAPNASNNVCPLPVSNFECEALVKSLHYVRSLVAQHIPRRSFQPAAFAGAPSASRQSLPTLSSLLSRSFNSQLSPASTKETLENKETNIISVSESSIAEEALFSLYDSIGILTKMISSMYLLNLNMDLLQLQSPLRTGVFRCPCRTSLLFLRSRRFSHVTKSNASRTQRIMESISVSGEVGGAGGAYSYKALKRLDQMWSSMSSAPKVVEEYPQPIVSNMVGLFSQSDIVTKCEATFDVIVCGGTLGIFIATALSVKGLRVGIVERNILKGREQEWNISRKELLELVEVGILTEDDIDLAIATSFNPNRCGFEGKGDIWVEDILNLGVSPAKLIEIMRKRFDSLGGVIFEGYCVSNIYIYDDTAVVELSEGKILSSHLIIDAMGNFSPIVKQIRGGRKPDGVCLVVGSCCRGFGENSKSDVIYSSASVKKVGQTEAQYFWEAFPAGSGPMDRTTYMFTYVDPQLGCPTLEELLEDYWDLMPNYQGVSLDNLEILRVIFGIFPTYRDSPLPAAFDRVLQFGDASGIQSPVSFGGFGSLSRHLGRLAPGIYEAVVGNFLDLESLSLLNPYMPNLSASWLFQRAMSAKKESNVSRDFINELLYANFQSMKKLGDPVLRPFLQDVIQFGPLIKILGLVMLTKPKIIPSIIQQVTLPVLLDWSQHFFMLGYYSFLSIFVDPAIRPLIKACSPKMRYRWMRRLEAWKYGAGLDYKFEPFQSRKQREE